LKYCLQFQLLVVFVGVIGLAVILNIHKDEKIYELDYFEKIGINNSFIYNNVIKSKGTPISEREEGKEDLLYVHYQDCILLFGKDSDESKDKYLLLNAKLISPKYKFGKYGIGVGSSLEKVKKAYRGRISIKDVKCGYVDGPTWVEFEIDTNKKVSSILISRGP
jgi:hypothetical protein